MEPHRVVETKIASIMSVAMTRVVVWAEKGAGNYAPPGPAVASNAGDKASPTPLGSRAP